MDGSIVLSSDEDSAPGDTKNSAPLPVSANASGTTPVRQFDAGVTESRLRHPGYLDQGLQAPAKDSSSSS